MKYNAMFIFFLKFVISSYYFFYDRSSLVFIFFVHPVISLSFYFIFKNKISKWKVGFPILIELFLPYMGMFLFSIFGLGYLVLRSEYSQEEVKLYDISETFNEYEHEINMIQNKEDFDDEVTSKRLIEPYIDVINSNDKQKKLSAIEKLSHIATENSVKILRMALDDKEYEVRYFASNALSKLEKVLIGKVLSLSELISRYPEDVENYNHRGWAYMNICSIGVVDEKTKEYFLQKAFDDFFMSLQMKKQQKNLYPKVLRILNELKSYEMIVQLGEEYLLLVKDDQEAVQIYFYLAEANFNLSNIQETIKYSKKIKENGSQFSLIADVASWWSSHA